MTCYHPISAWQHKFKRNSKTGKSMVVFTPPADIGNYRSIHVPCGQCIGCRLDYSRQWAQRCYHELSLYDKNCFITLTYDDDHVPWSSKTGEQTLFKRDLQLFWKSLRKKIGKFRYFACGEYGDDTYRPHYHAIIFGFDFPDKQLFKCNRNGDYLYISDLLFETWKKGQCLVGNANYDTAAYVARYVVKKLNGPLGKEKYEGIEKEFVVMSRRPGIGRYWYDKYKSDLFPSDDCIVQSYGRFRRVRPAKYYSNLYDIDDPASMEQIKLKRQRGAEKGFEEQAQCGRLDAMEEFKVLQTTKLKRSV